MSYSGPERRIHRIVVTENSEYHLRRRLCLLVRDRTTGEWVTSHRAIRTELLGAVATSSPDLDFNGSSVPRPGERMMFDGAAGPVFTTPVVDVLRAPRELVETVYPPEVERPSPR